MLVLRSGASNDLAAGTVIAWIGILNSSMTRKTSSHSFGHRGCVLEPSHEVGLSIGIVVAIMVWYTFPYDLDGESDEEMYGLMFAKPAP